MTSRDIQITIGRTREQHTHEKTFRTIECNVHAGTRTHFLASLIVTKAIKTTRNTINDYHVKQIQTVWFQHRQVFGTK